MNTVAIRAYKRSLTLRNQQHDFLVGTLLGDGHLECQTKNTARLKVEHTIVQSEYVMWKYDLMCEWVRNSPHIKIKKSGLGVSLNLAFTTLSHPELGDLWSTFYRDKDKQVPIDISLSPFALAVWFMDDGSRKSKRGRGLYLNTQSFNDKSIHTLQLMIDRDFGIKTTVRMQQDGSQIYIPAKSTLQFVEIVKPFVIPSMRYKLPD